MARANRKADELSDAEERALTVLIPTRQADLRTDVRSSAKQATSCVCPLDGAIRRKSCSTN
jgi:hypothetical protein